MPGSTGPCINLPNSKQHTERKERKEQCRWHGASSFLVPSLDSRFSLGIPVGILGRSVEVHLHHTPMLTKNQEHGITTVSHLLVNAVSCAPPRMVSAGAPAKEGVCTTRPNCPPSHM
jgi:hypothetical protein